jgi:23S rRNA (uracil1939-C5)-methyltransferase
MARRKKTIVDIKITGIADRGMAVGRTPEGQVVFVEKAIPGDVVDSLILRNKKGVPFGIVSKYKAYSPDRIKPICEHFGVCGGCKWQNLDYQAQLKHKTQTVIDAMSRIAKVDTSCIEPILPSQNIYQYRNKLEYSFSDKRWLTKAEINDESITERGSAVGFHPPGSYDKIVAINKCHLQDDLSNKIRNFIKDYTIENGYSYYDTNNHKGLMRNLILRNNLKGEWMLTVSFGENDDEKVTPLLDAIAEAFPQISSLYYVINEKKNDTLFDQEFILYKGNEYLVESLGNVKYNIGPKSFFQTNTTQAHKMYDFVKEYADISKDDVVYDLYTGIGSIALYVAENAKSVTGIEEIAAAIDDANINKELNNISNCSFYAGDVKDILNPDFISSHGIPNVVITDPPRAGMHPDVVNTLMNLNAPKIVYVSCNPATQARDIAMMKEKYEVTKMQPIDMFPHTHHVENIALLKLKN